MKYMVIILVLASAIMWTPVVADEQSVTNAEVRALIEEIDQLYRSESSYAVFEMEIVTPHYQRTLAMEAWSLGTKKTLIRINAPRKEKGVSTLRIDNEMWNYLPKTDRVIRIPPSMMMSSWMGSDFTNDDLVQEFSLFEDYSYELTTPDSARDDLIYINCVPREDL
ncbi:MAG: outer membrane lipoprotein-sorting protein, partial [candidate division Zixibacteria bacterium]|nr:outer membrane lipoprotein-sorting protein [candidate division Zixibacteria bacterium]